MTTESTDKSTPIINSVRKRFSNIIVDKLFFWYIDNIITSCLVDQVDYIINRGINISRGEVYDALTLSLQAGLLRQLGNLKGRNAELGFCIARICSLINSDNRLSINNSSQPSINVDFEASFDQIFEAKAQIEEERREIGFIGIVRDILVNLWKKKKNEDPYLTEEGYVKIDNKLCYTAVNDELKKNKGQGMSPAIFTLCIRELGFEAPNNRKKMKIPDEKGETTVRLCNIFDLTVLRKIGLPLDKIQKLEVKQEKIG